MYQWDYLINCNKNDNDNGKIDHIDEKYIDQDVNMETNTENTVCLGKTISLHNTQHLRSIWGFIN